MILFFLISSCGNQLIKQSPQRRKADTFYRLMIGKKGFIYHQRCKNIKKKDRECSITEYDLLKEWDFFNREFILIPSKYVFP